MDAGFKITVDGKEATPLALAFEGRLREVVAEKQTALQRAYPRAMSKGVTNPGKAALRRTIEATGFYRAGALAKTWRAFTYPTVNSLEPAAWFKSRAGIIVGAFEEGVTITVKGAQFLAIPEGPAKGIVHQLNRARARSGVFANEPNPVQRVAAALGTTLVPIISRDGTRGVLVAASGARVTPGGRLAKRQRGAATVLFSLVRSATLKKRPMGRQVLADIQAGALGRFTAALATELGPEAQ